MVYCARRSRPGVLKFFGPRHTISLCEIQRQIPNVEGTMHACFRVPKDQLTNIKNKKCQGLLSVDQELRVCLSAIPPHIEQLCRSKQAHVSH